MTYKLIYTEANQPERTVILTDEEVDAIYSAMGDYADYGDEETELANSIRNKLS
jgi:hypothetical protein